MGFWSILQGGKIMKIEKISKSKVLKLAKETEYLVWQGCGG